MGSRHPPINRLRDLKRERDRKTRQDENRNTARAILLIVLRVQFERVGTIVPLSLISVRNRLRGPGDSRHLSTGLPWDRTLGPKLILSSLSHVRPLAGRDTKLQEGREELGGNDQPVDSNLTINLGGQGRKIFSPQPQTELIRLKGKAGKNLCCDDRRTRETRRRRELGRCFVVRRTLRPTLTSRLRRAVQGLGENEKIGLRTQILNQLKEMKFYDSEQHW